MLLAHLAEQVLDEALDPLGLTHLAHRLVLVDAAARDALEQLLEVESRHLAHLGRRAHALLIEGLGVDERELGLPHTLGLGLGLGLGKGQDSGQGQGQGQGSGEDQSQGEGEGGVVKGWGKGGVPVASRAST